MALRASPKYIPVEQLEGDYIYLINGRNSYLGIWEPVRQYFVIIREKLGREYLDISMSCHAEASPALGALS